jgi:valyl-tRNA synthetase
VLLSTTEINHAVHYAYHSGVPIEPMNLTEQLVCEEMAPLAPGVR